jgi:hypothetical protein
MSGAVVVVRVDVERTLPPLDQQPHGEQHDDRADQGFRGLLDDVGEERSQDHNRDAEREHRRRMAKAPSCAEPRCGPRCALARARDERRHRHEMVRISRMTQTERERDADDDCRTVAAGQAAQELVEAEHQ